MRAVRNLVVTLLGLLLFAGCALLDDSSSSGEENETSESSSPSASGSPSEKSTPTSQAIDVDVDTSPLAFDKEASTTFEETDVYGGEVIADRVVTMTLNRLRARALPDYSSAWELSPEGMFVDVEQYDGALYALDLLVEEGTGTAVGGMQVTVQRLSPATGTVLDAVTWKATRDVQSPGSPVVTLVSVVEDVALVESRGSEDGGRHTLTALDLSTGEVLWVRRPGALVAADERIVVVSTSSADEPAEIMALELASGNEAWRSSETVTSVKAVGVHEGVLVAVKQSDPKTDPMLVSIDLGDGNVEEVVQVDEPDWTCWPASTGRAVCSLPGEKALGYDLRAQRVTWRLPTEERYGVWITEVTDEVAYAIAATKKAVVLDAATGIDLSGAANASPSSVNGYGGLMFYAGRAIFFPALSEG